MREEDKCQTDVNSMELTLALLIAAPEVMSMRQSGGGGGRSDVVQMVRILQVKHDCFVNSAAYGQEHCSGFS